MMSWFQFDQKLQVDYRLTSHDYGGSPDCFFYCVKALLDLDENIQQLREHLADYVLQHPPDPDALKDLLNNVIIDAQPNLLSDTQRNPAEEDLSYYVRLLRKKLYAGDIEIAAVCCLYQVSIRIYAYNPKDERIHGQNHGDNDKQILLCFHGNHYRGTTPNVHTSLCVSFFLFYFRAYFNDVVSHVLFFTSRILLALSRLMMSC